MQAHRHTGIQARRHAGTQTNRHTGTQASRHTDIQAYRHAGTQVHRHVGIQDTQTHAYMYLNTLKYSVHTDIYWLLPLLVAVVHVNEQTTAAEDSGRRQQWDRASYKKELRRFRVRLESGHSGHSAPRERNTPSNDGVPMCSFTIFIFFPPSSIQLQKMLILHFRVAAIRQIARTDLGMHIIDSHRSISAMAGQGGGRGSECDAMLLELRRKHEVKSVKALPARSTVGLVLEGAVVNIVVPGSPSYHANGEGQRIQPGDVVVAIDGVEVTKSDIIPRCVGVCVCVLV